MKISELARLSRCSTETIRYYEKIGLLSPPGRGMNNYRHYNDGHAEQLRFVRNCRSLDMTHDEIRELLNYMRNPGENCTPINDLIRAHLGHVTTRINELRHLEKQLHELHQRCSNEGNVSECGIVETLNQLEPQNIPSKTHLS